MNSRATTTATCNHPIPNASPPQPPAPAATTCAPGAAAGKASCAPVIVLRPAVTDCSPARDSLPVCKRPPAPLSLALCPPSPPVRDASSHCTPHVAA
eukprot:CAMPEP_0198430456 /NCGR_PEP_ID=MMETSP1452-20131203/13582_1 /TAXON_ID=1181717 /ORGANISM="Synchroma pusillum, Strain CCMP3072" /LENGTH=96 /DNA_ID=CAMNT_0044150895 /DNA_START=122 /DNA_END=412 /DNA_ORIENTATION=-